MYKKKPRKSWFRRMLISIDQFFNVLILNGSEDHTISGRVGFKSHTTGKLRWRLAEMFINTLFFFDEDHCYNSIEWDRAEDY